MEQQEEIKFAAYARAVWRRRWLVVVTTIGALIAGFGASMLDDSEADAVTEYEAVAVLQIEDQTPLFLTESPASVAAAALLGIDSLGAQGVQTHIELIQSNGVLTRAVNRIREATGTPPITDEALLDAEALKLADNLSVSQVLRSELISISVIANTPNAALLGAESIVGGYQEFLRDQSIQASEDAIGSIDQQMDVTAQTEATSTRVRIFLERLSVSELDRIDRAVETGISQLNEVDVSAFSTIPPLEGLMSELDAATARFETASIGLETLEQQLSVGSGTPAFALGQQSIDSVQSLVLSSLKTVRTVESDYATTGVSADLNTAISEVTNASGTLSAIAFQLGTLSTNLSVPIADRPVLAQLRDQALAVRGSNETVANSIESELNAGTADDEDRRRMLTQFDAGAFTLQIVAGTLSGLRQNQTSSTVLTQVVGVEGQLQAIIGSFTESSNLISTNLTGGPEADLAQLETLLVDVDERLDVVEFSLGLANRNDGILKVSVDSAAAVLRTAAVLTTSLRTDQSLRAAASFVNLALVEPEINTGVQLLEDLSLDLASSVSLSGQILVDRISNAQNTAEAGLNRTQAIQATLAGLDLTGTSGDSAVRALDGAASDLAELAISVRSASQVIEATVSAGVSQQLTSQLARYAIDLSGASDLLTSGSARLVTTATALRDLPEVRVAAALSNLEAVMGDILETRTLVTDIQAGNEAGNVLSLADAGEIGARLVLIQANISAVAENISVIPSPELELTGQGLRAADARLQTLNGQLADIEASQTATLDDLFDIRSELRLAALGPRETGVALVDSVVNDPAVDGSSSPLDLRIFVAAFGGLILGIIGAFSLEFIDRTVRRAEDIVEILRVPALGLVPQGAAKGNPHPPEVTDDPVSIFSESVHLVATRIQGRADENSRVLLIASPRPREGKTMMAINLAEALSLRNLKVLLIDANFRKPDSSRIFEFEDEPGLATALTQDRRPEEFIREVQDGRLHFLPAGRSLVPPVELISRPNMATLLDRVRQQYDFVIIDGPPALGFAESNALAKLASAIIIVARAGVTKKSSLREATENLADSNIFGVVMNFVSPKDLAYLQHRDYERRPGAGGWGGRIVRLFRPPLGPFSRN